MAASRIVEYVPGALPDIRGEGGSIVYRMKILGASPPRCLIIRCGADGNVTASIAAAADDTSAP